MAVDHGDKERELCERKVASDTMLAVLDVHYASLLNTEFICADRRLKKGLSVVLWLFNNRYNLLTNRNSSISSKELIY